MGYAKSYGGYINVDRSVITKHLNNIYKEEELSRNSTCAKIALVQTEGSRQVKRNVDFYNLDAIISVGYRVNSHQATKFRIWATGVLKEYMIKGFVLERAVSGYFDYIEDLIERENTFTMEEFEASINEFLSFRRYDILRDNGKVSTSQAKKKAESEYDIFNKTQKITSDFDKAVSQMLESQEGGSHI